MQTGMYCFTKRRFFFLLLFFQCTHCPNFKIKYSISSWIFPKKNFEKRNEPFHYILKITIYRKSQVVFTVLGRKFVPYRLWSGFAVFFFFFFFLFTCESETDVVWGVRIFRCPSPYFTSDKGRWESLDYNTAPYISNRGFTRLTFTWGWVW
jgi:hypothetical protein